MVSAMSHRQYLALPESEFTKRVLADRAQPKVERILNYKFRNPTLLARALYAAGSNGFTETLTYSHKRFAQHGQMALRFVLEKEYFLEDYSLGCTNKLLRMATSDNRHAHIAVDTELHLWRITSVACEFLSEGMLATLVRAFIGAVEEDCGSDMVVVRQVCETLGLFDDVEVPKVKRYVWVDFATWTPHR